MTKRKLERNISILMLGVMLMISACGKQTAPGEERSSANETEAVTGGNSETEAAAEPSTKDTGLGQADGKTPATEQSEQPNTQTAERISPVPYYIGIRTEYVYSEEYLPYVSASYETVELIDKGADDAKLSGLMTAIESFNSEAKRRAEEAYESYRTIAAEAVSEGLQAEGEGAYTYMQEVEVERADDTVLSLRVTTSSYTGGAHPNYFVTGCSYDVKTGEEIGLTDVVADEEAFRELVYEKLSDYANGEPVYFEDYSDTVDRLLHGAGFHVPINMTVHVSIDTAVSDMDEETEQETGSGFPIQQWAVSPDGAEAEERLKPLDPALQWVLTSDGLKVMFSPYDIAPYAAGTIALSFSYEKDGLLFANYLPTEDPRVLKIRPYEDVTTNANGDTVWDEIYIEPVFEDADAFYGKLRIRVNETEILEPLLGRLCDCYLFWDEDYSALYLYVETSGDNDQRTTVIYDLSGKEPVFAADAGSLFFNSMVPTDAEDFMMYTRMDMLSTYSAWKGCRIGKDGLPEAIDPLYQMDFRGISLEAELSYSAVKTLREIDAYQLGKEDEALPLRERTRIAAAFEKEGLKKVKIPAGTRLRFIRTDGKSFVDMRAEDGMVYRVYCDTPEYGTAMYLGGTNVYELFDGLLFAG